GRSYEGMQSGRQGVREAFTRMVAPPVVAQTAGARLIDAESKARQRHTGIIANTGRELAKLGAASARATAGLAGVGLGVAGHAATKGIGALGRGLGVMGSLVGGVGGATLLGGMYVGGKIIDARAREKDAISDTEDYSSASAYRTALGQASMATQSFADAVNQARNDIEGGAGGKGASPTTVSEEDVRQARTPGRAYTDPRFANMGQQEAGAFISTALPNLDEAGKQLLKLDALKRFGNAQMVEDWMGQTTPDLAGLFENVGKQRWFSIGLTDESIKAGQGAGTSGAGIVNVAPADQTEEVRAAALLEGVWGSVVGAQKEKQKEWLPNTAQEDMSLKAAAYGVANMLGTSDDESYKEIVGALRAGYQGKNAEDTWRKFYDKLLAGKSTAAQLLAQSPEVAKFIPRPVSQVGGDDLAYGWNNYTLADEPQEPAETPLVGGKRQTQIALERVNR